MEALLPLTPPGMDATDLEMMMRREDLDLHNMSMTELIAYDARLTQQLEACNFNVNQATGLAAIWLADRRQIRNRMQELRSGAYHMGGNNG